MNAVKFLIFGIVIYVMCTGQVRNNMMGVFAFFGTIILAYWLVRAFEWAVKKITKKALKLCDHKFALFRVERNYVKGVDRFTSQCTKCRRKKIVTKRIEVDT